MRKRPFFAILAVMGFVCAALLGFMPATPRGVQCPTAPVQRVTVRDCCGRVVDRAPRPGDRVFVQCACAEKKSQTVKAAIGSKIDLLLPSTALPDLTVTPPAIPTIPRLDSSFCSASLVPPTPPPA